MYTDTNIIGERGEHIVTAMLMTGEVFRAELIGGKFPDFDIYAEVNDVKQPYPFLVQVKSTTKIDMYTRTAIKTPISDYSVHELSLRPIPTYVAGFDEINKILYIAPIFSGKEHYPSVPVLHKCEITNDTITTAVLNQVKKDVVRFYNLGNLSVHKLNYVSLL